MQALILNADLVKERCREAVRVFHGFETLFMQLEGFLRSAIYADCESGHAVMVFLWQNLAGLDRFQSDQFKAISEILAPYLKSPPSLGRYEVALEIDRRYGWSM